MVEKVYCEKYDANAFFDSEWNFIPLPSLFSLFLNQKMQSYSVLRQKDKLKGERFVEKLELKDVSENTIVAYHQELTRFLKWYELQVQDNDVLTIQHHHNAPSELLNLYLNDHCIVELKRSVLAIAQAKAAIDAYYNYLNITNLRTQPFETYIRPDLKSQARDNTKSRTDIKYISQGLRNELIRATNSVRDELLLRFAAECGLRACEIEGMRMNDFRAGKGIMPGFKTLVAELESLPNKSQFEFWLRGNYSKGGKSRMIYIHRSLLERVKDYIESERPASDNDALFITRECLAINTKRIDAIFAAVRGGLLKQYKTQPPSPTLQKLGKGHTYHNLRHSFGTDQFYKACQENQIAIDNVTATSAPYLYVARLLGHSISGTGVATTTATYIHSCKMKENIEREAV